MQIQDLPLYSNLIRLREESRGSGTLPLLIFSGSAELPQPVKSITDTIVIAASAADTDWRRPDFWSSGGLSRILPGAVQEAAAVFYSDPAQIPAAAPLELARSGFNRIFYLSGGVWNQAALSKPPAGLYSLPGLIKEQLALMLRKALLKICATDLIASGVQSYQPEQGHCYIAPLPALEPLSDGPAGSKDALLFFEEKTVLTAHCGHDEIRSTGLGRSSLWGGYLYFSSSDNSDPNSNGRRYRYVDLRAGLPKRFRGFLSQPAGLTGVGLNFYDGGTKLSGPGSSRVEKLLTAAAENPRSAYLPIGSGAVAIFIADLALGGAQKQAVEYAIGLKNKGTPISLFTCRHSEAEKLYYLPSLRNAGIAVSFIDEPHSEFVYTAAPLAEEQLQLLAAAPLKDAAEAFNLYTQLTIERPPILHCFLNHSHCIGALAAALAGTPRVVLSETEARPDFYPDRYSERMRRWLSLLSAGPRAFWIADSVLVAQGAARWLGLPPDKFSIIEFGKPVQTANSLAERRGEIRESFGIPRDALVIAAAFRFSPEKRPLRLIRLINDLAKKLDNLHAVIAGAGPLMPFMRTEIENLKLEDKVHLIGIQDDVQSLIAAADLAVLTSIDESVPEFLIEAQLAGLPAVSPAVGAVPAIIRDGETGYLCDKNDYPALLERSLRLLMDAQMRAQFGRAAKLAAESISTLDQKIAATFRVYGFDGKNPGEQLLCA